MTACTGDALLSCEGVRYRQSGSLHWDSGWSRSALLALAAPLRAHQRQLAGKAIKLALRSSGGGRGPDGRYSDRYGSGGPALHGALGYGRYGP